MIHNENMTFRRQIDFMKTELNEKQLQVPRLTSKKINAEEKASFVYCLIASILKLKENIQRCLFNLITSIMNSCYQIDICMIVY